MTADAAKINIGEVAKLARISLSETETELFGAQLAQILEYAGKLQNVDVSGVDPSAHAVPMFNIFRDDEPRDWFTAEDALKNAPRAANELFVVTKVLE